jgi:hypothetical protein
MIKTTKTLHLSGNSVEVFFLKNFFYPMRPAAIQRAAWTLSSRTHTHTVSALEMQLLTSLSCSLMCVRGATVLAPLMVFHSHDLLRLLSLLYLNIGLIPKSTSIYPYYYIILVKKNIFMVKIMLKTQINIITCICYLF